MGFDCPQHIARALLLESLSWVERYPTPGPPGLPLWMDPAAPDTRGVLGSEGPGRLSKGQKMETEKRIPKSGRAASPPAYIKPQEPARLRPPGLRGTIMSAWAGCPGVGTATDPLTKGLE